MLKSLKRLIKNLGSFLAVEETRPAKFQSPTVSFILTKLQSFSIVISIKDRLAKTHVISSFFMRED